MKKIFFGFFIGVLCATNSFGADGVISRVIPVKNNVEKTESTTAETTKNRSARRVSVSRNTRNTDNVSRGSQRGTINVVPRESRKTSTRQSVEDVANNVGRNQRTDAASINSNPAVRRAGVVLRASTAEVGGRAKIIGTDKQTGSNIDENIRNIRGRALSLFSSSSKQQKKPTAESIAQAKEELERLSDLNSTCQQQYNECMDQFCMVVDANQKRCSCSANLAKYANAQKAVEDANSKLNDVAQNIRYIGLSADEIRAIMNETEAELAMSKTKDTSETRSMLDDIANMIKDPTSASSTSLYSDNSTSLLDMEFDFSSDSTDLFGLDLFSTNAGDISSKRGKELYREATKRCKTVLNQCKEAGGTESQITGNYDLAIDKDCIAYEQGLEKLNQQLVSNVRSANLMLQKARLSVLQNKNQYDMRGCIGALEECMLDDMVCGEGYIKCLDPTKNYIDENGNVVLGRNIANIVAFTQDYNNSNITSDFIKAAVNDTTCQKHDGACIVNYLMNKIGKGQTFKDGGLCRAVLDKCQYYTYTSDNSKTAVYNPYNEVVVNYIQRVMVNIKAAQSKIISDYASTCLSDISDCYNQQVTQINTLSTTATANSIYNVMTGACYNVALTCGYAVFAYDADVALELENIDNENERRMYLIREISDLFYQSLLCPSNSTFISDNVINSSSNGRSGDPFIGVVNSAQSSISTIIKNRTIGGYVNARCKCDEGYSVWNGACLLSCSNNEYRNNLGACVSCSDNGLPSGGNDTTENNSCIAGCPTNSTLVYEYHDPDGNGTDSGYVTSRCKCNVGYHVLDGTCIKCPEHSVKTDATNVDLNRTIGGQTTATCKCNSNYTVWNGTCVSSCQNGEYMNGSGVCTSCSDNLHGGSSTMEHSACISCPENSTYNSTGATNLDDQLHVIGGWIAQYCKCNTNGRTGTDYVVYNGNCTVKCPDTQYRDTDGTCKNCDATGYHLAPEQDPNSLQMEYYQCISN